MKPARTVSASTNGLVDTLIDELDQELKLGLHADLTRTGFARGVEPEEGQAGVDRNTRTIFGVAIATKGPALGHDMLLDDVFLDQLTEAGAALKQGVKARFDHPNMSSTSMGTAIGRFKQFRRAGDVVRADLHLLKSAEKAPEGNYPDYLMELAEEDPQSFGTSIVFANEPVEQLDEDGDPITDNKGHRLPQLARLKKLYAADVVDEPAANPNGFFSTSAQQQSLAGKITQFLDRYFARHGITLQPGPSTQEDSMSETNETPKKDVTAQTSDERSTPPAAHLSNEDILARERTRVAKIMKFGHQMKASPAMLNELVGSGASVEQAYEVIGDDAATRRFTDKEGTLAQLNANPNKSAGGPSDDTGEGKPVAGRTPQERWENEYLASKELQAEFETAQQYVTWRTFETEGRISLVSAKA